MPAQAVSSYTADELALRLHQQELVAQFGLFALRNRQVRAVVDEACRVASDGLRTRYAKVLQRRADIGDFLVCAGVGWRPGVVGHATVPGGSDSPAGYALLSATPVVSTHLGDDRRFRCPELLIEHGIQSAINVIVGADLREAFGVLEVDSSQRGAFEATDTAFLQSLANILAVAIERDAADDDMRGLLAERTEAAFAKDALLREKDLLMQEVHHRVKNSLQLVRTLLQLQARSSSPELREQLEEAAGRIMTISALHRRLYEGGSVATTEAGPYLEGLVGDLRDMLADNAAGREIELVVEPMRLPADQLTPVGLVTTELVTNALKYGAGRIGVRVCRKPGLVEVIVEDEGPGFAPDFDPARSRGLGMRLIVAMAKGDARQALQIDRDVPHSRIVARLTVPDSTAG